MMSSDSVQAFNDKVAASPELQAKLRTVTSPVDFLMLAKAEGFDLTGADLQAIAQNAYQHWIESLNPKVGGFFSQVRNTKVLDDQLKTCQTPADVMALAQQCDIELSDDDLQQAARAAEAVPGFSFEKLWFRGLGLIS